MENQKDKKKKKVLMPFGLRNKLIAAISMLLVSSIMMVSSTYAWFTLSTAPEVKGISTSVGANGNLEIALLNPTGDLSLIKSNAGDSSKELNVKNLTWGNLVDLSYTKTGTEKNFYGLDNIQLMPARLNATTSADGVTAITKEKIANLLLIPSYGTDGRVDQVNINTINSGALADTGKFSYADGTPNYGVRAIGVSGDMTAQETGLMDARASYKQHMAAAREGVSTVMYNNMQAMTNAVIAIMQNGDLNESQQNAVNALITASDKSLTEIDKAYGAALKAYAASKVSDATQYAALSAALAEKEAYTDIKAILEKTGEKYSDALSGVMNNNPVATAYGALQTQQGNVQAAQDEVNNSKYKEALKHLMDVNKATINDLKIEKPQENASDEEIAKTIWVKKTNEDGSFKEFKVNESLATTFIRSTNIKLLDNSGVLAYIGSVASDITVAGSVDLDVTKGDFTVTAPGVPVTIQTVTTQDTTVSGPLATLPAAAATGGTKYITDTYGYVVDMAFRTNAADSKLRLSTDGIQRIYNGNEGSQNEQTMGEGSNMTFKSATEGGKPVLNDAAVAKLMQAIRVVFFDPTEGTIYGVATIEAKDIGAVTVATGETTTEQQWRGKLTLKDYTVDENNQLKVTAKTVAEDATAEQKAALNDLMALTQNTAAKMSVLVYLDGDNVDNSMVANAAKSIEGKLNLQFTSSAKLVPMKNSQLFNGK